MCVDLSGAGARERALQEAAGNRFLEVSDHGIGFPEHFEID